MSRLRLLLLSLPFALSSCMTPPEPYAKNIDMEPGKGGTIMIWPSDNDVARQKAQVLMSRTCGSKKAQIVKEGEVKVGTTSTGSGQSQKKAVGFFDQFSGVGSQTDTKTETNTRDIQEWHIVYKCN